MLIFGASLSLVRAGPANADEAQNIKNHRAKCSLACFSLSIRATSKWCLTGTPIQNNAYEMFSLIHFLRVAPFDNYGHFKEKIGEPLKST